MTDIRRWTRTAHLAVALLAGGALAVGPNPAAAQIGNLALDAPAEGGGSDRAAGTALARDRYAIVIDLDENRLFFRKGELTLWSAPVGTGTGLRLRADGEEWKFSTPNGVFQVEYKEQDPDWLAPDWYFVENGLAIPPAGDPKRRFPGGLGAAALFIENDLAIHGTNKPELLGQRVSHGCIRLSNRDALRLYHNVQVGTEVVIVGGDDVQERVVTPAMLMAQKAKATFDPTRPAPEDPVVVGWKALPTAGLLEVLANELWLPEESTRWPEVSALLLARALEKGDDEALRGLMTRVRRLPDTRVEREYATFLADAYARAPVRTLTILAAVDGETQRARVAHAIVEATINLYPGDFADRTAPWPTRRLPRDHAGADAEAGWDALAAAEASLRNVDL